MPDIASSSMIEIIKPQGSVIPLVLDSPHSGTHYPNDFHFICPQIWLQQTEDKYVDVLFGNAPQHGAVLLKALFTRSYIDVNRAMDDLDPTMIEGVLPFALEPTERTYNGYGLIRHLCRGQNVYAQLLTTTQIQKRLDECYLPYHRTLKKILDTAHRQFGEVWHLNCHSMPSNTSTSQRPDFVLGDLDGTSAGGEYTHRLGDILQQMGYSVAYNNPYKGVEIVRRSGHPRAGFHSVQLEINRALYMNEDTLELTANAALLKRDLDVFMAAIREWILAQLHSQQMAAE
jgi:N-formylglutamate deformylase